MKYLDDVRVIVSKPEYEKRGVYKGAIGTILLAEIRTGSFYVVFSNKDGTDYAEMPIDISDLELVQDNGMTDEDILEDLPLHNPEWGCKVEDGFILNLKGEKLNKIPYDYQS